MYHLATRNLDIHGEKEQRDSDIEVIYKIKQSIPRLVVSVKLEEMPAVANELQRNGVYVVDKNPFNYRFPYQISKYLAEVFKKYPLPSRK